MIIKIILIIILYTLTIMLAIELSNWLKEIKIIKSGQNIKRPQQMSEIELIIESKKQENALMYTSMQDYKEYLIFDIEKIVVEKWNDKLFFQVNNLEKKDYRHTIIFRNTYLILLKINMEGNKSLYKLIWREIK